MLETLKNHYSEKLFQVAEENGFEFDCELTNNMGYMYVYYIKRDQIRINIGHVGLDKGFRDEQSVINDILNPNESVALRNEYEAAIIAEENEWLKKVSLV